jgi:HEXXH motif-containing protein
LIREDGNFLKKKGRVMESHMALTAHSSAHVAFRGYSCPYEPFEEALLHFVLREYATCVGRLFLDRHRDVLGNASRGLTDALESWLDGDFSIDCPIDPVFGEAGWALNAANSADHVAAGCAMALYLGSKGLSGHWDASLPEARTLRWGAIILPRAKAIAVESDGDEALIEARLDGADHRVQLHRTETGWQSTSDSLPQLDFDRLHLTILPRGTLEMKLPAHVLAEAVESIEPAMLDSFREALAILHRYVPAYVPWVGRVLTHAFLLSPQRGYVESGSLEHYLGFVHFSAYTNPAALGELLIHEASHQYFNILCLLGSFDDGTDERLYYSTAVRRPRPLSRIGIAYHAFANVLIYYRECIAGGIDDDGWCARHLERWTADLGVLEEPLRRNPALTNIGRALCEPLFERLALYHLCTTDARQD